MDFVKDFTVELRYKANTPNRGLEDKVVIYWLAGLKDISTKVKLSDEHQDFKWLALNEACNLAKFEDMKKALHQCEDKLKTDF